MEEKRTIGPKRNTQLLVEMLVSQILWQLLLHLVCLCHGQRPVFAQQQRWEWVTNEAMYNYSPLLPDGTEITIFLFRDLPQRHYFQVKDKSPFSIRVNPCDAALEWRVSVQEWPTHSTYRSEKPGTLEWDRVTTRDLFSYKGNTAQTFVRASSHSALHNLELQNQVELWPDLPVVTIYSGGQEIHLTRTEDIQLYASLSHPVSREAKIDVTQLCVGNRNIYSVLDLQPNSLYYFDVFVVNVLANTSSSYIGTFANTLQWPDPYILDLKEGIMAQVYIQKDRQNGCLGPETRSISENVGCKYFHHLNAQRAVAVQKVTGLKARTTYLFDIYVIGHKGHAVKYQSKVVKTRKAC
ncbi:LOW QUALITY PROTEIN: protein NDNF-like [Leucoraja erinacea]|uniref:LOW QUALITY PROTEIN: protein NDNF-like n=1 Tax=Leucoraja erinaceus TaxID=7782 RepID=UPI0024555125|nr:LOW QUALITY PROTEIN: protein NDNF-like [Leucoraja erinacea]